MLIVCAEQSLVEAELVAGRLGCPLCRGVLGPWGHGRERVLRCSLGDRLLRPRRGAVSVLCGQQVLLPELAFVRRQDEVSVIGQAIEASVAGEAYRRIASRLGVPARHGPWLAAPVHGAGRAAAGAFHALCGRAGSGAGGGVAGRERRRGRVGGDRGCCEGVGAAVRVG